MAILTIANTKGGSGKTTLAFGVGMTFAQHGLSTALLDADPQGAMSDMVLKHFASVGVDDAIDKDGTPLTASQIAGSLTHDRLTLVGKITDQTVIEAIDEANRDHDMVVVDLQGSANLATLLAMQYSDLVIIPANTGANDLTGIVRTATLLRDARATTRRHIPGAAVLVNTSPSRIVSTVERHARDQVLQIAERHTFNVLVTELCRRKAFTEMTYSGALPGEKDATARENLGAVVREISALLKAQIQAGAA